MARPPPAVATPPKIISLRVIFPMVAPYAFAAA